MRRAALSLLCALSLLPFVLSPARAADAGERHLLYVVAPGIRDYLQFGGAGVLVFDMDRGHQFVKRIDTPASRVSKPENIKEMPIGPKMDIGLHAATASPTGEAVTVDVPPADEAPGATNRGRAPRPE